MGQQWPRIKQTSNDCWDLGLLIGPGMRFKSSAGAATCYHSFLSKTQTALRGAFLHGHILLLLTHTQIHTSSQRQEHTRVPPAGRIRFWHSIISGGYRQTGGKMHEFGFGLDHLATTRIGISCEDQWHWYRPEQEVRCSTEEQDDPH